MHTNSHQFNFRPLGRLVFPVVILLCLLSSNCWAHHRHHLTAQQNYIVKLNLDPIAINPVSVSTETNPVKLAHDLKFHLEDGLCVSGKQFIVNNQVTNRDLFILQITQSLEGGFDTVNIYDRGILSWGVLQWTAQCGNLTDLLMYIKTRLTQENHIALWNKLFAQNGIDVDNQGLLFYGKHANDETSLRVAIRGSAAPGKYYPNLTTHWATVFARAGMQPEIQQLQTEFASKTVDGVLSRKIDGCPYHLAKRNGMVPDDLVSGSPYTAALIFALWDNNPEKSREYILSAAKIARSVSASDDPSLWKPVAFDDALFGICAKSKFGNWQQRAELIQAREHQVHIAALSELTPFEQQYQQSLVQAKSRQFMQLASRHKDLPRVIWNTDQPITMDEILGTEPFDLESGNLLFDQKQNSGKPNTLSQVIFTNFQIMLTLKSAGRNYN